MNRCFPAALLVACVTVAPLAAEQQDVASEALIGLARVKRDARDMAAARRYFEEASRRVPLTLEQRTEYFWILSELDPRAALAVGRGILHEQPGSEAVRDRVIASALAAGDESTVIAVAIEGRRLEPETARWPRRLAESYLRTKNYSGAVTAYRSAAEAQDANDSDRAGLAFALEGAGDHAHAAEAWRGVPSSMRAARPDWMASYLRSRAMAGAAAEAAPEIQSWLERHPDDLRMRALLVEIWARDGRPDRALALLDPLRSGPDATQWVRREATLARAAGDRTRAIRALESLLRSGQATSPERWDLAELLTEVGDTARAAELSRMISQSVQSCDERLFTMMDRLPDPIGTDLLLESVSGRRCDTRSHWIERAIARAVAAGRHQDALTALAELPYERANRQAIRRLEGQLRLWTGDPAGAIEPLQDAVAGDPDDVLAREALVDAYRATGRGYAAWEAAEPLLQLSSLSPPRLTLVAELALDADRPEVVSVLGDRLAEASVSGETWASLQARALLAEGRPGAAVRLLQPFDAARLAPAAALALLDGLIAMGGHAGAAATAARFASETADWKDVLARRLVIATMAGDERDAGRIRSALQRVDPVTAVFADADAALAAGRPLDALAVVDRLGAGEQPARQADIRATVLTLTGQLTEAAAIVRELRATRPRSVPLAIREAHLAWRIGSSDESLEHLTEVAAAVPANQIAASVVAHALSSVGRHEAAIAILERVRAGGDLPLEGAVAAAQSLRALGRPGDALAILDDRDPLPEAAAIIRAELTATVQSLEAGVELFRGLAGRRNASPAAFTRWVAVLPTPAQQRAVLENGVRAFPANAELLASLGASRLACGDLAGAAAAASEATRIDPDATGAWLTLITAAAATRPAADVGHLLRQFTAASTGKPSVLIGMAEHVAGLVRAADDPLLHAAEAMLQAAAGDDANAEAREIARARLLAAGDRWPDALEAIDAVLNRDARSRAALRLRADILSWSGAHAAALEAFDAYLLVAPGDTGALRQRARVTGWKGEHAESLRLYEALLAGAPGDAVLAAEASAKRAFYGARWPLAVRAYEAWLALEPANSEARFELAEALRASGELARADSTLFELSAATGHRLAAAARERALYNRRPSVTLSRASREADGYGAARLLELREETGAFAVTLGHHGATMLQVDGARMQANGDHVRRYGSRGGVRIAAPLSPEFLFSGHASVWHFSGGDLSAAAEARVEWRVAQIWKATLGLERELVLENEATVDSRLAATGILTGARAETRNGALEFRAAWQKLSDGNTRRRISLQVNRSLGGGLQRFRVLGRAEELAYTKAAGAYFSPPDFLRVDAGVEYAHPLTRSRFRGDRHGELALGYLAGTDNRGVIYHQPTARFAVEVGGGIAIDGRAAWIRSAVYDHQTLSIGVRLGGGAGAR